MPSFGVYGEANKKLNTMVKIVRILSKFKKKKLREFTLVPVVSQLDDDDDDDDDDDVMQTFAGGGVRASDFLRFTPTFCVYVDSEANKN